MRIDARELLAVGIFGRSSRLGDRIDTLLRRGRNFSPHASARRVAASTIILSGLGLACALAPRWIAFAQQQPRPVFDVISIHRNLDGRAGGSFRPVAGGRFTATNNPVAPMIAESYGHLLTYQIVGAPSWLNSEHFDIEARAEGNPAEDRIMLMVQSMLEDRFQLKIHHETRELPVFILTAAKGGLKVQAPRNGSCVAADPFQAPVGGVHNYCGNNLLRYQGANVAWDAMGIDMAGAAKILSSALHRAVIDKTGFTGKFDVHVKWTADRSTAGITDAAESAEPAVFTVLNTELGLQLKAGKGPVDVLVIDHVEPPDAN